MTQSTAFKLRRSHQETDIWEHHAIRTSIRSIEINKLSPRGSASASHHQQPAKPGPNPPNEGVSRSSSKVPRPPPKRKKGARPLQNPHTHPKPQPVSNGLILFTMPAGMYVPIFPPFHCLLHPHPRQNTPLPPNYPDHPIPSSIARERDTLTDSYRQWEIQLQLNLLRQRLPRRSGSPPCPSSVFVQECLDRSGLGVFYH